MKNDRQSSVGSVCLSGSLQVIDVPRHHDFVDLRRTPAQLRQLFTEVDAERVVAFQPQTPLTVRDEQFSKTAAEQCRGTLRSIRWSAWCARATSITLPEARLRVGNRPEQSRAQFAGPSGEAAWMGEHE